MARRSVLRDPDARRATVGNAELFFDLVYVFAVTQLSHYLLAHGDLIGVLQTAVLFGAVWWAWTYMTWATNWLDPDAFPVRLVIFAMMLVGLAMGAAMPQAFGRYGLIFALTYSGAQLVRTALTAFALRGRPDHARNLTRVTVWFAATAPLWIGGALLDPQPRLLLWAAAIVLELAGPAAMFWVPGLGRSATRDYDLSGEHMAERCGLFIIVALGEGLLVTGATAAQLNPAPETLAAFVIAFLSSVAMWWIYFDRGAEQGSDHIAHADDTGRIARNAYSYVHLLIVGGIIIGAVGDELIVAHPLGHLTPQFTGAAIGGPALFLFGCMLFKREFTGFHPLSHIAGLAGLGLVALAAALLKPPPLAIGAAGLIVLLAVAVWEWRSFHGGWSSKPMPARNKAKARKARNA